MCQGTKQPDLIRCIDSDWVECRETRKSTGGFVYTLAEGGISWRSKIQPIFALSTCEAEHIATSLACKEAIWLSRLLSDVLQTEPKFIDLR